MDGEAAPLAREALLEAVETQVRQGDPPEAREALERMMGQGCSREDAVIMIARALAAEMYEIVQQEREHDAAPVRRRAPSATARDLR